MEKISSRFSQLRASLSRGRIRNYSLNVHDIRRQYRVDYTDVDGNNALHIAAREGKYGKVKFFLTNLLDIHAKNEYGFDALMLAAKHGHKKIVKKLLASGADVSAKNILGQTAYELAKLHGQSEIAGILAVNIDNQRYSNNSTIRSSSRERYVTIRQEQHGIKRGQSSDVVDLEIKRAQGNPNKVLLDERNRLKESDSLQVREIQELQDASSLSTETQLLKGNGKSKESSPISDKVLQMSKVYKIRDASSRSVNSLQDIDNPGLQDSTKSADVLETAIYTSRRPSRINDAYNYEASTKHPRTIRHSMSKSLLTEKSIRPNNSNQRSQIYDITPVFITAASVDTQDPFIIVLPSSLTRNQVPVTVTSSLIQDPLPVTVPSSHTQDPLPVTVPSSLNQNSVEVTVQSSSHIQDLVPVTVPSSHTQDPLPVTVPSSYTQDPVPVTLTSFQIQDAPPVTEPFSHTQDPDPVTVPSSHIQDPLPITVPSTHNQNTVPVTVQSSSHVQDPVLVAVTSSQIQDTVQITLSSPYTQDPVLVSRPSCDNNNTTKMSLMDNALLEYHPDKIHYSPHSSRQDAEGLIGDDVDLPETLHSIQDRKTVKTTLTCQPCQTTVVKCCSKECQTDPTSYNILQAQHYSTSDDNFKLVKRGLARSESQTSSITLNFINYDQSKLKTSTTDSTDFNHKKIQSCPNLTINNYENNHYSVSGETITIDSNVYNGVRQETDSAREDQLLDGMNEPSPYSPIL